MARRARGACGSARIAASAGQSGCGGCGEVFAQAGQAGLDAQFGFGGEAEAVAGDEFEQAEGEFGLHIEPLRSAEMHALAVHAEIGIGDAGAEVAELGEQGADLDFAGFERADGGAVDVAGVAVVFAHPLGGAGKLPVLGQGVLGVEGEQIVVAAGLDVEVAAQAGQEVVGVAQLAAGVGGAVA